MKATSNSLVRWRNQIFLAAWTLYAGYYMCRKDIASPTSAASIMHLAASLAYFGAAYALGQLISGDLADRFGARPIALSGAAISVVCTLSLAFCAKPAMGLGLVLQLGNGFGQGFGWPSLLKLIGGWFHADERDRVLGWWSTSYILGGLLATSLSAWLVVHTGVPAHSRLHPAYIVSSVMLSGCAIFFYIHTAKLPETLDGELSHNLDADTSSSFAGWRSVIGNRRIRVIAGVYFFLKMTRYTLLFWLPPYLVASLGRSHGAAEHIASYFELSGFLGPLLVAYAVPRWFRHHHLTLGAAMLFTLAFVCLLHPMLASSGELAITLSISVLGVLIYGADVLLSGMAVLDSVPDQLHGRAAGFVNGVGSLGQIVSPFLITVFVSRLGWTRLFDLFVFFALTAGSICAFGSRQMLQTSETNRSALESSAVPL